MTERQTLEKVAKGYHDLQMIQRKQRQTEAKMIRACVARVQAAGISREKKNEALSALLSLADMLDPQI